MFEIGRRAAGDVSVFLLEVVLLQSPHRQGPFAQHVAGHGALRFALAKGLFGLHLLLQGFAVVRWTVENTWLRWNQKYLIRSVCRELMR